jgi:hypothetical protein
MALNSVPKDTHHLPVTQNYASEVGMQFGHKGTAGKIAKRQRTSEKIGKLQSALLRQRRKGELPY